MKKILFLFAFVYSIQAHSQITITKDDMPTADDSLRYSISTVDATTAAIYTETGENFTWDFSHLEAIQQRVANYERAWRTPYALYFLGFDKYGTKIFNDLGFGEFALTDVYDFYQNKTTAFEAEGRGFRIAGVPVPAYFSDDDEIYQFPLTYERMDSSTFAFEVDVQEIFDYRSEGYRINRVDGWGNITTPYGTFACIRLVSDIVAFDTVRVQGFDLGFRNTRREYKWLAKGEAFPILEISGVLNLSEDGFTPTNLRYRDDYRLVESVLAPTADFEANITSPFAVQDTVQLSALTPNLPNNVYEWQITPTSFTYVNGTTENSRNPALVFTESGIYDVQLRVENDFGEAESIKLGYIVVGLSAVKNNLASYSMELAPNPVVDGNFYLTYELPEKSTLRVALYHLNGELVEYLLNEEQGSGAHRQAFQLKNRTKGIYFLNIQINEKSQAFPLLLVD